MLITSTYKESSTSVTTPNYLIRKPCTNDIEKNTKVSGELYLDLMFYFLNK